MFKPKSPFYIKPRFNRALLIWLWEFKKASRIRQMHKGLSVLRELGNASMKLFDRLISDESLVCHYRKDGWLLVYKTDQGFRKGEEETHLLQKHDIEVNVLTREETLKKEPSLHPEISGGIFFPGDAHLDPRMFVGSLSGCLRNRGVKITTRTKVLKLEKSKKTITRVITNRGVYRPKHVVLAAGAWSKNLVKSLNIRLPLQSAKGYCITVQRPVGSPGLPLYFCEAKVAVTPFENVLRLAGTLEISGMDASINQRRVDTILCGVRKYLEKKEDLSILEIYAGLRPCFPDGLPVIDRLPGCQNLVLATGHCMLGITLAPISGKLVSKLVIRKTPDVNITPLETQRFC
jgi:D-amino-acid dehydrogenase